MPLPPSQSPSLSSSPDSDYLMLFYFHCLHDNSHRVTVLLTRGRIKTAPTQAADLNNQSTQLLHLTLESCSEFA